MADECTNKIDITESVECFGTGTNLIQKDTFDDRENIIETQIFDDESGKLLKIIEFDLDGNKTREREFDENEALQRDTNYIAGTNTITRVFIYENGVLIESLGYVYDEADLNQPITDDLLIEINHFNPDNELIRIDEMDGGTVVTYWIITYNGGFEVLREQFNADDDTLIQKIVFDYVDSRLNKKETFLPDGNLIQVQRFNENGELTKEEEWTAGSIISEKIFDFIDNEAGRVTYLKETITYSYDALNDLTRIQFTSGGKLVRVEIRKTSTNELLEQEIYIDEAGFTIRIETKDGSGNLIGITLQEWSEKGNIVRKLVQDKDENPLTLFLYNSRGELVEKVVYTYREDGTLEKTERFSMPLEELFETITYDTEGNLDEKIKLDSDGEQSEKRIFKYGIDPTTGEQIVIESDFYLNVDGEFILVTHDEYNTNGSLLVREQFDPGTKQRISKKEYTYTERCLDDFIRDDIKSVLSDSIFAAADGIFELDDTELQRFKEIIKDECLEGFISGEVEFDIGPVESSLENVNGLTNGFLDTGSVDENGDPVLEFIGDSEEIIISEEDADDFPDEIDIPFVEVVLEELGITIIDIDFPSADLQNSYSFIQIGSERMGYEAKVGNRLTGLHRGAFGTERAEHTNGSLITLFSQGARKTLSFEDVVEDCINEINEQLGVNIDEEDPAFFYTKEVKDILTDCVNEQVELVIELCFRDHQDDDLDAFFGSKGFRGFAKGVEKADERIQALKFPEPPPDSSRWQPTIFIPTKGLDKFKTFMEGFRDTIDTVYEAIKVTNIVAEQTLKILNIKFDSLNKFVDKLITEVSEFIDATGNVGFFGMYLTPSIREPRTLEKLFQDFEKTFAEETDVQIREEKRFVPNFKEDDFITGIGWIFAAPQYQPVAESIKKLTRSFGIAAFIEQIKGHLVKDFVADVNYDTLAEAFKDEGNAEISWTNYDFDHLIELTIEDKKADSSSNDPIRIENYSPKRNSNDFVNNHIFKFKSNRVYNIQVSISQKDETRSGKDAFTPLKSVSMVFETPSQLVKIEKTRDEIKNWDKKVKENVFQGPTGNGFWFGMSTDSIYPDFFQLKTFFMKFLNKIENSYTSYTAPGQKIIDTIARKQKEIFSAVTDLTRKVDRFLEIFEITVENESYYKWIPPQTGGNQKYIDLISDTNGIHPKHLGQGTFTGGVFFIAGGPTLDGMIGAWDALRAFMLFEDNNSKEEVKKLENDVQQFSKEGLLKSWETIDPTR